MKKKIVAVLMIMAFFSTAVFAAPLSTAGSPGAKSSEFSLTEQTSNGFDDLFADVAAVPLTDEEALDVEGEGFLSGFLTAISTIATVTVDVFKGDWAKAGTDLVVGVEKTIKDLLDPTFPKSKKT